MDSTHPYPTGRRPALAFLAALFAMRGLAGADASDASAADGILDTAAVLKLEIEIAESQMAALRNDHRAYVPAIIREGGVTYRNAGVRLKGSAGSFRPIDAEKPGFTVKVNQFGARARFHGLRKFLLNNGAQDASYLSEILGNEIFRAAGVPAARGCHALVTLNGKDYGLYVLFESVSSDFLARHFESPDGNLYEGPGDVGGDVDADRPGPNLDQRDLRMLANAAMEPNPKTRMARLNEVLDVDRFVTFVALEAALWHWDGYAVGVNNYRIYDDPCRGQLVFLPHGSDQLFQDPTGPITPEVQGLVARALLSTPIGQQLYSARLKQLSNTVLDSERLRARAHFLTDRIQSALAGRSDVEDQKGAAANLLERILSRFESVREQLRDGTSLFGVPLAFDERGIARLGDWKPKTEAGSMEIVEDLPESGNDSGGQARWLHIRATGTEKNVASWRTKVLLPPGKYRLAGRVRYSGVRPTEKGEEKDGRESGVSLRVSHHQPGTKLTGSSAGVDVRYDFIVTPGGVEDDPDEVGPKARARENPPEGDARPAGDNGDPFTLQVQLVCELEAQSGEASFDATSLLLIRR